MRGKEVIIEQYSSSQTQEPGNSAWFIFAKRQNFLRLTGLFFWSKPTNTR